MEEQKVVKLPTIKNANMVFFISMFLFVIVGEVMKWITPPTSYFYRMLITVIIQILFVLAPAVLYICLNKWNFKEVLRFNKISLLNGFLSSLIILCAIPLTSFVNFIGILILKYFGKLQQPPVFPSENLPELLLNLFVIALIPALFEEIMFRGFILRGYQRLGSFRGIIVTSLLFALLHRSLQTLIGTFVLGIVIAYVVYRTNSIFAGMIAHFTNNGFVVILTFGILKLQNYFRLYFPEIDNQAQVNMNNIPNDQLIAMLIVLMIMAVFFGILLTGLIFLFNYTTKDIKRECFIGGSNIIEREKFTYAPLILSIILVLYKYLEQIGIKIL